MIVNKSFPRTVNKIMQLVMYKALGSVIVRYVGNYDYKIFYIIIISNFDLLQNLDVTGRANAVTAFTVILLLSAAIAIIFHI